MKAIDEITNTFDKLPKEMKQLNRWILWNLEIVYDKATGEPKRDNDGNIKYTKVPKQPNGYNASSTNENHYVSFRDALSAYETGKFSGIGFCLVEDDPYIIIDLDDCFYNGELLDKAKTIVDTLGSYTEKSQSGNGLHIVVRGKNLEGFNNQREGVEMYSKERFFAMTGNVFNDYTTVDDADEMYINYLDDLYRPNKKPINNEPVQDTPQEHDDNHILMKIRNTKVKNDARDFPILFDDGDIKKYSSASDADYALAKILAKHTGNIDQIERLMRDSALYRPEKWDEHPDYLRGRTIKHALSEVKSDGINNKEDDFQLFVNNKEKISLVLTEKGKVQKLLSNLKEILKHEEKLNGVGFNEFTQEVTINGDPITDEFISDLRLVIDSRFMITFTKDDVTDMVGSIARERNTYHPIKRYIESTEWDGKPRAEKIFIDYLGADNVAYTRSVTRKWLAGAVARIYEPGVKMEMVPVLQGNQGIGKSTLPGKLGDEFFVDTLASMGNTKDDYQLLIGSWIIELAELASLNSSETEKIKSFISARFDKLRLPYGKIPQKYNRTCVFIGTTNNSQYLNDLTGNRRFFPIPLENEPKKDVFSIEDETIQQIWAESLIYYKQGEKLFLDSEDDEAMAEMYRSQAEEESLFFMNIDDFLNMKVPKDWNNLSPNDKKAYFSNLKHLGKQEGTEEIDRTTTKEIAYILDIDPSNRGANPQIKKINLYMDNLDGWRRQTVRINGESKKGFSRKTQ